MASTPVWRLDTDLSRRAPFWRITPGRKMMQWQTNDGGGAQELLPSDSRSGTMAGIERSGLLHKTIVLRYLLLTLVSLILPSHWNAFTPENEHSSRLSDEQAIRQQLGYLPSNFVAVSARNEIGLPIAIQTYPLDGGARRRKNKAALEESSVGTPFPTLYWLTCPSISRAIAEMERQGYVGRVEEILRSNSELTRQLVQCHREYAKERWDTLSEEDQSRLQQSESSSMFRIRQILELSGVAGTNITVDDNQLYVPSVKCLHAHYADFRSATSERIRNPVGQMVHEFLVSDFSSVVLWCKLSHLLWTESLH